MELVESIDRQLLYYFTRFSHWFQRKTGRTNYLLAKFSCALAVVSMFMEAVNFFFPTLPEQTSFITMMLWPVIATLLFSIMLECDRLENNALNGKVRLKPLVPGSLHGAAWRMWWVALSAYTIWVLLWIPKGPLFFLQVLREDLSIAMAAAYYFLEVSPLPPGQERSRTTIAELVPARSQ